MEVVFERLLIELLAIAVQVALLRLLTWLRSRSSGTAAVAA